MKMRFSPVLSAYIGRHFLVHFLIVAGIFLSLIFLIDVIELLRRLSNKPDVPSSLALEMALLKLPHLGQQTFPFAVLFAGMSAFWRLTRSHELVVTRAAGVSAWQFMFPVIVIAIFLGVFRVGVIDPIGSVTLARYERLEANYLRGESNLLSISDNGLWLRQANLEGQSVVHSVNVLQQGIEVELGDVSIFVYKGSETFSYRIEAKRAVLEDGFWHLFDVTIHRPEQPVEFLKEHWFETDLTLNKIQDSFSPPETMSFWSLPSFIKTLEQAGFSAKRHKLHFHALLASPVLLCAMVLIAATFTLRSTRKGGTTFVISVGVFTGFIVYFISDIVYALALSESVPVVMAAWTPASATLLLGLAMLLHLEDG